MQKTKGLFRLHNNKWWVTLCKINSLMLKTHSVTNNLSIFGTMIIIKFTLSYLQKILQNKTQSKKLAHG